MGSPPVAPSCPAMRGRQQQVVGRQTEREEEQEPQNNGPGQTPVQTGQARARGHCERQCQAHEGHEHQQEGGHEEDHGGIGQTWERPTAEAWFSYVGSARCSQRNRPPGSQVVAQAGRGRAAHVGRPPSVRAGARSHKGTR